MFIRILLITLIVYIPNQLHFPSELGIKGLNVFNILLLVSLGTMMSARKDRWDRAPLRGRILFYFAILTLALVIGLARNSAYLGEDLTLYKTAISYCLLYFVAYHTVHEKQTIRILMLVMMGVVFLMSIEALREALDYGLDSGKRVAAAFGDTQAAANYAGVFFAIFVPMGMSLALFNRQFRIKMAGLAVWGFGLIAVFYTLSRTALAAVAATTVLLWLVRNKFLGILVLILAINYAIWAPAVVQQRIESTTQVSDYGEEKLEESAESRFYLWNGGWEIIKAAPYGIGLNQFHREIGPHLPPWIIARDAHNHLILITAEAGILGGFAYLLLMFGFYSVGLRVLRFRDDPEARAFGYGYVMCVTGLILGNIYNSLFYSGEVMGNFWIMTGLMTRYAYLLERDAEAEKEATTVPGEPEQDTVSAGHGDDQSSRPVVP